MHMHIAGRHQRQAGGLRQGAHSRNALDIIGLQVALESDPATVGETPCQPSPVFRAGFVRCQPQRDAIRHAMRQIAAYKLIAALLRTTPAQRDDGRQIAVAGAVLRQQHQLHSVCKHDLGTDQQLESRLLRRRMRTHDAGEGTFVGDRQCRVAECLRLRHQFLRM